MKSFTNFLKNADSSQDISEYMCQVMGLVINCLTSTYTPPNGNDTGHCGQMWSFSSCWPASPYGQTAFIPCSEILLTEGLSEENDGNGTVEALKASRYCNSTTGEWNDEETTKCALPILDSRTSNYDFTNTNFSSLDSFMLPNGSINNSALLSSSQYLYSNKSYDELLNEEHISDYDFSKWKWLFEFLGKMVAAGHGVSLVALLIAIILILSLRRLRCTRVKIHLHLMFSFILRGALWILHWAVFIENDVTEKHAAEVSLKLSQTIFSQHYQSDVHKLITMRDTYCKVIETNQTLCRIYYVVLNYCVTANYYWLLVEGLYLKMLLRAVVFSHSKYMKMFILLGWAMPWLSVLPWVLAQVLDNDKQNECWITHQNPYYWWIIKGPILLSLLINFYVFVTVMCVVGSKLRATAVNQNDDYKWRLTKSTLALIPLLGIQYIMTAFWTQDLIRSNNMVEMFVKKAFEGIFTSIQGLFVAVIYCFCNSEVREETKKKWAAWKTGIEIDRESKRKSTLNTQLSCNLTAKFFFASISSPLFEPRKADDMESEANDHNTMIKENNGRLFQQSRNHVVMEDRMLLNNHSSRSTNPSTDSDENSSNLDNESVSKSLLPPNGYKIKQHSPQVSNKEPENKYLHHAMYLTLSGCLKKNKNNESQNGVESPTSNGLDEATTKQCNCNKLTVESGSKLACNNNQTSCIKCNDKTSNKSLKQENSNIDLFNVVHNLDENEKGKQNSITYFNKKDLGFSDKRLSGSSISNSDVTNNDLQETIV